MSTTPNEPGFPQEGQPDEPGRQYPPAQDPTADPRGTAQPYDRQYGQQGGKYGTAEYNPAQYTGMLDRPAVFDRLLKLTLVSLGIYVLSGIIGMIAYATTDLVEVYRQFGLSTEMAEQAAAGRGAGWVSSLISLIIGIALYLLVYNGLRKGRNWARILGTVFAVLAVVGGVFNLFSVALFGGLGILMAVIAVLKIIVDIVWIVTAFRAPNSAYFAQNRRR